jgi:hypothetical protein
MFENNLGKFSHIVLTLARLEAPWNLGVLGNCPLCPLDTAALPPGRETVMQFWRSATLSVSARGVASDRAQQVSTAAVLTEGWKSRWEVSLRCEERSQCRNVLCAGMKPARRAWEGRKCRRSSVEEGEGRNLEREHGQRYCGAEQPRGSGRLSRGLPGTRWRSLGC